MKKKDERLAHPLGARESAEELLRRIEGADEPGPLVAVLAPHDLLAAWRQAGDEQRAELLRLASPEQTALLIDLECWRADRPDIEALAKLAAPLVLVGVDEAQQLFRALDGELRTLLLKSHAKVHLLENRNDELEVPETSELLVFPDGLYHVEFPEPDAVTDAERALWNALCYLPFEEYQPELECVRHELSSELEEEALRWRNARLADWGFAPREEAIAILAPRSVEEVRRLAVRQDGRRHPLPPEIRLPVLYRESLSGHRFLDRAIAALRETGDPGAEERIAAIGAELAAMTNSFLTASAVPVGDLEAVARGIRQARDLLALGLFETAGGDPLSAARLLFALVPATLLQVGLGIVYPLRKRARALLGDPRFAAGGHSGALFDPPYQVGLSCLAREIPCRWPLLEGDGGVRPDLPLPRPEDLENFATAEEVSAAVRLLEEAERLGALVFGALAFREPPLRETPASVLLLTALAHAEGGRALRPDPVTPAEARSWGERVAAIGAERFLAEVLAAIASPLGFPADGARSLGEEPDPARRLVMRLVLIGRARLLAEGPERAILMEPV